MVSKRPIKNCLIIFAKSPEPGKVKTRLCPPLSHQNACKVYLALLRFTLDEIQPLKSLRKVISYTGSLKFLKKATSCLFEWLPQSNGDFGERLQHVCSWSHKEGNLSTVIIGTDAYLKAGKRVMQAFQKLQNHDLVMGPAWDGGFYLLGFRNKLHENFFKLIRWSSPHTLLDTLRQARRYSYKTAILPMEYDVDDENGLKILRMEFREKDKLSLHARQLAGEIKFIQDMLE